MSLSAVSSYQLSAMPDSLVPTLPTENAVTAAEASKAAKSSPDVKQLSMFAEGDDAPSFWDLLDVINPLQHIPIINNLYREATGDKIGVAARLVGGTLFGGPIGLIASAANCILEESTGEDAGGHVLALFRDDDPAKGTGTALASAEEKAPAADAQLARMEESPVQQSQILAAAAAAKAPEPKLPEPKSADDAKAQPLIMGDLVGGDTPASAPVVKPVASPSAAAPVPTATEQVASAANRPMPLGREPRLMPIPGRNTPLATQSPPAIGTTVSSNGFRSNAPVTGYRPSAQRAAAAATAQQMAAAQAESSGALTTPGLSGGQSGDWFSASMMQAMDKYEKSSRLGTGGASTVTAQ
ncbi:hypothetical protein CCC_00907 [Paramagnetospirillum magnetotacticum MS-1]|uniref:Uncharacterized protein n=1 Tax=Paramagnetospirillum magnetotacticum MS-1 TaxID=272627 RepID=A0A0C2UYG1_PARME|nr:hypothetical protein [Paramagnetospirillum magnetotacticum]KIL97846.1 hypothetical protein CCC_00907 [Paramagnetospirillum magnetotacticum MS-1]